jgi:hypothetical protein
MNPNIEPGTEVIELIDVSPSADAACCDDACDCDPDCPPDCC